MGKPFSQTGLDRALPHIRILMEKRDTSVYPKCELPAGYHFSHYKPGFERLWAAVQCDVEHADTLENAEAAFKNEFLGAENTPRYKALTEKMLFIMDADDDLAGTGAIWDGDTFGEVFQQVHWIAVASKHQNKGLSKSLLSGLLDIYNALGYGGYIYLSSQTWSYKAINVYMKFGFRPYMGVQPANWRSVNMVSGNYEPWDYAEKNAEAWKIINNKIRQYNAM